MLANQREKMILEELNGNGIVNVNEIAEKLGVSVMTIRRDLNKLEKMNKLKRVHGGAVLSDSYELTMTEKMILHYEEKRAICRKAAEVVEDGDCVFIDGGSTLEPMYEFLKDKNIRIVTNNDLIIRKVENSKASFVMIGGDYLPHYNMNVGTMALKQLANYSFDHCFIGCTGLNFEKGMAYTVEQETKDVKTEALANADKKYLLADSSKINVKAFVKITDLNEFDRIIIDKTDIDVSCDNLVLV